MAIRPFCLYEEYLMGSKPKKDDYKATDSEVASSAVAQAEYTYFKQNYEPLLLEMRDKARNENFRDPIRGRASADVAQALTGDLSLNQATNVSALGDIAGAYSGQLQKADEAALGVKNTMSTGVLGTARKQAAEAQTGMAQASRLATSQALTAARANQQVAQSKLDAGMQIAGAITLGAIDKYGSKPKALDDVFGQTIMPKGALVTQDNWKGGVLQNQNPLASSAFK
jgi:hypothetical protein